ncbi:unnamed protein product [Amoebophrya sp. A25]|nr:unnamed protein product [Amoebophrya sp. A25]|eukprot:GSA25T00007959001.1
MQQRNEEIEDSLAANQRCYTPRVRVGTSINQSVNLPDGKAFLWLDY